MKKAQIIGGVCIGAILLVTVCYVIYGRSTSFSGSSDNREQTDTRDVNKNGISKGGIFRTSLDKNGRNEISKSGMAGSGEKKTPVCPPCPAPSSHPELKPSPPEVSTTSLRHPPINAPQEEKGVPKWTVSGATGRMFSGEAVRQFPRDRLFFRGFSGAPSAAPSKPSPQCERWAVVTTIFEVSESVRRQVKLRGWCLVVVADKKSPKTYDTGWMAGEGNDAVVYLTPDNQTNLDKFTKHFVDALPWNHFGRKNVGYLYAIMHGAKIIWDFDDDNALKFWIPGAAPSGAPSLDAAIPNGEEQSVSVLEPKDHNWPTYNPYPALGAPTLPSWPRGLPLDDIKVPNCSNTPLHTIRVKSSSIAVLQSLAEYQPDVDAIFRLTMPIPFFFNRPKEDKHLMIPKGCLTPYNAQATLHFRAGFFALFLPVTVAGRVSDIWRSYIAQRLFWDVGLQVGFIARPLVVQDRNVHNYIGDLGSEWDLYTKGRQLMKFLENWKSSGRTIVERTEELCVALYEREYIEYHDVELIQMWLRALLDAGYRFPDIVDASFHSASYPTPPREANNGEDCISTKHFKFWTSDRHDGSRVDMPSFLSSVGHKVTLAGRKGDNGPYSSVFEKPGIKVYDRLSSVISENDKPPELNEKMIKDNFEFYKTDREIATTDVFMCSYPPSLCEMWMPFNKTIAVIPANRYNLGRCGSAEWNRFNEHLKMLAAMDTPKHIIGASSVYDQEYLRYYTGLDPLPLYSLTTTYTAGNPYNPTKDEILCFSRLESSSAAKLLATVKRFTIVNVKELYPRYKLSDLVSHRAVVYFPYSVMSYKLSEIYGLGIPLFVPSPTFLKSTHSLRERTMLDRCSGNKTAVKGMKPDPRSTHPYNPNIEGGEDGDYWIQFSDFYQWSHITYFNDMHDLEEKLSTANFEGIHELMMGEVRRKRDALKDTWCRALKGVETGRKVPRDYNSAIQQLYGVTRLQVS